MRKIITYFQANENIVSQNLGDAAKNSGCGGGVEFINLVIKA